MRIAEFGIRNEITQKAHSGLRSISLFGLISFHIPNSAFRISKRIPRSEFRIEISLRAA